MIRLSEHEILRVFSVKVGEQWIPVDSETLETDALHIVFAGLKGVIYKVSINHVQAVRMRAD